jgi:hypothetical protein
MWENKYPKGKVISGKTAREVLSSKGIDPDFTHQSPTVLDYIHRQTGENDIYFIRNTSSDQYSGECSFRVENKYPELWDPSSGEQLRIDEFTDKNGRISFNLDLEPNATVFIVFNENSRSIPELLKKAPAKSSLSISGEWKLTFPEGWGAPAKANFDQLISWTESEIEGIKYFSGTAAYHKTFTVQEEDIKSSTSFVLDLGEVCDVAEVFLNGQSAGILWKAPYAIDVSKYIQSGQNELKIEVVNQWVNRLTGDMLSDPEDRFCRTNMPYVTSDDFGYDNWIEDSDETFRLKVSGLLGPVNLNFLSN